MLNAREASYLALLASLNEQEFISDFLNRWKEKENPSYPDFRLAREIALGTMRELLTLNFYAKQILTKLPAKKKEKALLWLALYQLKRLDKVPSYAIVDEAVKLAKKYCHRTFVSFLNAFLRKALQSTFKEPSTLSEKYSFPPFYCDSLLKLFGEEKSLEILEAQNCPGKTFARHRKSFEMKELKNPEEVEHSQEYYIQNKTPAALIKELANVTPPPKTILDLCASPGGKLIAAHDLFPNAKLFANDVSEKKLEKLLENLDKYEMKAHLHKGRGEEYPLHEKFDLIIIDAPCSNTGVLGKRVEARWRLSPEGLNEHAVLQKQLLERACRLLTPKGMIWYLTCSILPEENENVVRSVSGKILFEKTYLPNKEGWDGGYGSAIAGLENESSTRASTPRT